jgi:cell division protein FtsI/penicillin-binding protein 2
MAAALDAGITSPGATYIDEGSIDVDGAPIYNWDHLPHGEVTMTQVLEKSLNVGAVHLALGLGAGRFYGYLQAFGLGAPTGVDLEGEVGGILHVPGAGEAGADGTLARASFGQAMAATPLQVASAMGAVANDGLLMMPHVVGATIPASGEAQSVAPRPLRQVVRPDTARALRLMLESVVSGHVTAAAIPGYRVGGKTGTSQIPLPEEGAYDEEKTIASFCGFLPVEQPRLLILVKVDRPNAPRGSDVAAPVFRQVAEAAIAALDIPPDNPAALLGATEAGE